MKASKKVIESVVVSGLAAALLLTAVTGNGQPAASAATETQLEENGIAGLSAVMNEYEQESADYLDSMVSVKQADTDFVAASAETAAEETASEETVDTAAAEESLSEEEQEWQDKLMADVDDFLYVRKEADADSEIVGKMYKGDRAVIKETGEAWTKIASGSVEGYVKNDYCVTGSEALAYAKKTCDTVAVSTINGLRVRDIPSTDGKIIKTIAKGDTLTVDSSAEETDGWVAVEVGSDTCYLSADYVTVKLDTGKAITIAEEKAALLAQQKAAAQSSSSGQTSSASASTQHESLAATADEETLLAALVQCEAGGCGVECMTAVGAVVLNRVRSGSYPDTIYGVIYQSGQFGPASSGRLESRLASGVSSSAREAARAALAGSDPTGGAKYFKLASSGHDGVVIGPIVFY